MKAAISLVIVVTLIIVSINSISSTNPTYCASSTNFEECEGNLTYARERHW